jgi:hypothetical protein
MSSTISASSINQSINQSINFVSFRFVSFRFVSFRFRSFVVLGSSSSAVSQMASSSMMLGSSSYPSASASSSALIPSSSIVGSSSDDGLDDRPPEYKGCWSWNAYEFNTTYGSGYTPSTCSRLAKANSVAYFAMQSGSTCLVSNTYGYSQSMTDCVTGCTIDDEASSSQYCGAPSSSSESSLSVYYANTCAGPYSLSSHLSVNEYSSSYYQYANINNPVAAVNFNNVSFSLCAWVRRDAIDADHYVLTRGPAFTTNSYLFFGFRTTNVFTFGFWGNDLSTPTTYTTTGVWMLFW